jgi:protease-4
VAGSGGYYIAMGANKILAQPETITGSIGVIAAFVNAKGTLDKLGIRVERVTRGKNAGALSPFAEPESVPVEALRKLIESFYWQFVDKAAQGRGKSREEIHKVAQGRVWTGKQALERGLIDELGGLDRSIEVARELAGLASGDDLEVLELPAPVNFFEALSEGFGAARLESILRAAGVEAPAALLHPEVRRAMERIRTVLDAGEGPLLLLPVDVRLR